MENNKKNLSIRITESEMGTDKINTRLTPRMKEKKSRTMHDDGFNDNESDIEVFNILNKRLDENNKLFVSVGDEEVVKFELFLNSLADANNEISPSKELKK